MNYSTKILYLNFEDIFLLLSNFKLDKDMDWYAIYRGGITIAHILSILNDNKDFGIIYLKYNKIIYPIEDRKTSAIIIDDNIGTGNTIKISIKLLNEYYKDIKVFSFLYDPDREIKPDYFCLNTVIDNENRWIEFPWDIDHKKERFK